MHRIHRRLMRTSTIVLIGAACALALPAGARQLGNGGTTYSSLSHETPPEEFLGKFVELIHADQAANAMLFDAVGVAAAGRAASAVLATLDMQASTADIGSAAAAAGASHQLLTQALATAAPLSAAQQASFASGALALAQVARDFTALTKNLGATKQTLLTAGMPARVALQATRVSADIAAQLRAELKAVVGFANARQLVLAAAVSEAAAAL
ncbi:hypothetical protein [Massilia sp. PWRC2]|uniref:hypothetical protein n=1 Tax=Massilia sp. PWRC2 TaxID=2804626 RepID=UPI003CE6746F